MQKLIRDNEKWIIEELHGKEAYTRTIDDDTSFIYEGTRKLLLDAGEYARSKDVCENLEKLADILEIVYALGAASGFSPELLDETRQSKAKTYGRFDKRIFLVGIDNGQ
jgi:predicted house-cleaning noncanonical NTP pyrophosphatase (MazG superfamily)